MLLAWGLQWARSHLSARSVMRGSIRRPEVGDGYFAPLHVVSEPLSGGGSIASSPLRLPKTTSGTSAFDTTIGNCYGSRPAEARDPVAIKDVLRCGGAPNVRQIVERRGAVLIPSYDPARRE